MTDVHHHHAGPVVEDRDSSLTGVLVVLLIAALIGFFVWLIGFSGVVVDRNGNDGGSTTRIEQNVDNPDNAPPAPAPEEPAPANS